MKQNKDRKELLKICKKYVLDKSQSGAYDCAMSINEEISELVDFVETHTQKKVEESKTELLEEILGLEGFKEEDINSIPFHNWESRAGRNKLKHELKQQIIDYKNK